MPAQGRPVTPSGCVPTLPACRPLMLEGVGNPSGPKTRNHREGRERGGASGLGAGPLPGSRRWAGRGRALTAGVGDGEALPHSRQTGAPEVLVVDEDLAPLPAVAALGQHVHRRVGQAV